MKTIISKNNDKSNICYIFNIENTDVMDQNEIANSFCDYFTKIGNCLIIYPLQILNSMNT